jgi:hypothetical protein
MLVSKREFQRYKCSFRVNYDFVKWNDNDMNFINPKHQTESVDISLSGIGLAKIDAIDKNLIKDLVKGEKKIKLSFTLYDDNSPVFVFARFVWSGTFDNVHIENEKVGCEFIDISSYNFNQINAYINDLKEKSVCDEKELLNV